MILVEIGQTVVQEDWRANVIWEVETKRADSCILLNAIKWFHRPLISSPLRFVGYVRAFEQRGVFIAGNV